MQRRQQHRPRCPSVHIAASEAVSAARRARANDGARMARYGGACMRGARGAARAPERAARASEARAACMVGCRGEAIPPSAPAPLRPSTLPDGPPSISTPPPSPPTQFGGVTGGACVKMPSETMLLSWPLARARKHTLRERHTRTREAVATPARGAHAVSPKAAAHGRPSAIFAQRLERRLCVANDLRADRRPSGLPGVARASPEDVLRAVRTLRPAAAADCNLVSTRHRHGWPERPCKRGATSSHATASQTTGAAASN